MTGAWEPVSCSKYEELRADPAMRAATDDDEQETAP